MHRPSVHSADMLAVRSTSAHHDYGVFVMGTPPPLSLLPPMQQGAQQQLQRIELLVKIQQYDNARMQLREGSFKSLRSDLRYEAEYRGVEPEVSQQLASWVSQRQCVAGRVHRGGWSGANADVLAGCDHMERSTYTEVIRIALHRRLHCAWTNSTSTCLAIAASSVADLSSCCQLQTTCWTRHSCPAFYTGLHCLPSCVRLHRVVYDSGMLKAASTAHTGSRFLLSLLLLSLLILLLSCSWRATSWRVWSDSTGSCMARKPWTPSVKASSSYRRSYSSWWTQRSHPSSDHPLCYRGRSPVNWQHTSAVWSHTCCGTPHKTPQGTQHNRGPPPQQ